MFGDGGEIASVSEVRVTWTTWMVREDDYFKEENVEVGEERESEG